MEAMLETKIEYCWEEKDLSRQSLLTIFSADSLACYTESRLRTVPLTTRMLFCLVAFPLVSKLKAANKITADQYIL